MQKITKNTKQNIGIAILVGALCLSLSLFLMGLRWWGTAVIVILIVILYLVDFT